MTEVQNITKELGRIPSMDEFHERTSAILDVMNNFGFWGNFLAHAGLGKGAPKPIKPRQFKEGKGAPKPTPRALIRKMTNDEFVIRVQILANKLGRSPTMEEFNENAKPLKAPTMIARFGSWTKFLEAAGLDPSKGIKRKKIPNEELIRQVKELAAESGRTPTSIEFEKCKKTASATTVRGHFGSWAKFLEAAGLEPSDKYTKDGMIRQIKEITVKLGRVPTESEFDKKPETAGYRVILRNFGSWAKFLEAAGLEWPNKNIFDRIPNEELIRQVKELAAESGRTPTSIEFEKCKKTASATTVRDHFGSWAKFLEAAGLEPSKRTRGSNIKRTRGAKISNEELIAQVRKIYKELGLPPTMREFDEGSEPLKASIAAKRFGSWRKFLKAAGLFAELDL